MDTPADAAPPLAAELLECLPRSVRRAWASAPDAAFSDASYCESLEAVHLCVHHV